MDFVRYAERSAELVNTDLVGIPALVSHLAGREWLQERCTERDCHLLRRLQRELRAVFEASETRDERGVVDRLNELLVHHPITPRISDHSTDDLHLHVATRSASVADLLIREVGEMHGRSGNSAHLGYVQNSHLGGAELPLRGATAPPSWDT